VNHPAPILPLENPIKHYAWGSRHALATICGRSAPTTQPEAEIWMGTHPGGPSRLPGDGNLRDLVAADPLNTLGPRVRAEFGDSLPFLLKLLAANEPLSLQAHPSLERAQAGFDREESAGVPIDAAFRCYKDRNHKPELLCALTPFHALVGFRPIEATRRAFEAFHAEELRPLLQTLRGDTESALLAFFQIVVSGDAEIRTRIAQATLAGCLKLSGSDSEFSREYAWGVRIGQLYPGDPGIALALALNLLVLEPGDAIYLPAGNLHAYLEGTGVEIMASSDNVLRGGLTPKHVDVPELLAVLDFHAGPASLARTERHGAETLYLTPTREFALSRFDLDQAPVEVSGVAGPEIVVATRGSARLTRGDHELSLANGASAFLPAAGGDYALSGPATVFRARVNS
jgi:mannose-6-phosphate isomerase